MMTAQEAFDSSKRLSLKMQAQYDTVMSKISTKIECACDTMLRSVLYEYEKDDESYCRLMEKIEEDLEKLGYTVYKNIVKDKGCCLVIYWNCPKPIKN